VFGGDGLPKNSPEKFQNWDNFHNSTVSVHWKSDSNHSLSEQAWKKYYDPCPFSIIFYLMLMMCSRPYNLASSTGNPALEKKTHSKLHSHEQLDALCAVK